MKNNDLSISSHLFDVIIIGGGSTGAGTARDCSKRGLSTLLIERSDIATELPGVITVCFIVARDMLLLILNRRRSALKKT